jgi:uncharacterized membrane protein
MHNHCCEMNGKPENWSVTLRPNSSLSPEGFIALMAIVVGLNFIGGLFFWAVGAWPVLGFMGLDVVLVWWAFRLNFAAGKRSERISINGDVVELLRQPVRGSATIEEYNRRWLRVELEFDEARELVGRLFLIYRGNRSEVGSFLGAEEREGLAKALRQILAA